MEIITLALAPASVIKARWIRGCKCTSSQRSYKDWPSSSTPSSTAFYRLIGREILSSTSKFKNEECRNSTHFDYQHEDREIIREVNPSDQRRQKPLPRPSAILVKLDPASQPGRHWIAIFIDGNGQGEYLDSYSVPPQNKHIKNFSLNPTNHTIRRTSVNSMWTISVILSPSPSSRNEHVGHFKPIYPRHTSEWSLRQGLYEEKTSPSGWFTKELHGHCHIIENVCLSVLVLFDDLCLKWMKKNNYEYQTK